MRQENRYPAEGAAAGSAAALLCLAAALGIVALAAGPSHAGRKLTSAQRQISRNADGSGGKLLASSAVSLDNTVGEVGAGTSSGAGIILRPGLINIAAQAGSITSITAVTKSTGALTLAWTAPGADGSQGSVTNGFYRVDFSSDASHVFSPTAFQLEFSTAVVPGSSQSLEIAGLLPNTTYFTRIYLADDRKYFAEDSKRSDESTLANVPINPVFSGVFGSSVTITWTLPAGGAEGFSTLASSTNFGAILPDGTVLTSSTASGLELTLTIDGLDAQTTYFFKVASLNFQGDKNFTTVLATVTLPIGGIPPVFNLSANGSSRRRTVTLTWRNPSFPGFSGVVVILSTSPATSIANGVAIDLGDVLADGSVVKSTSTTTVFNDSGLTLDTTFFYHLFTHNDNLTYSVRVSTFVFLDLPPMGPAGLATLVSPDRTQFTVRWAGVGSNDDGTPFKSTGTPLNVELDHYEISRATGIVNSNWVRIASVLPPARTFTDTVPNILQTFFYKVEAVDAFANKSTTMVIDTDEDLYVLDADGITRMKIPRSLRPELNGVTNQFGTDLLVRTVDQPADPSQSVVRAVNFEAVKVPGGEPVVPLLFSKPEVTVALHYVVQGGNVVPMSSLDGSPSFSVPNAANNLSLYWNNGVRYVPLYGQVDTLNQIVSVPTAMTGSYQIRGALRNQQIGFDIVNLSNKFVTPNGDGLNDVAVFHFDNQKGSDVAGQVFDLKGSFVSDMASGPFPPAPGPGPSSLQWDGKAGNRAVPGGVYVYQIRSEGKVFTGTLVVIR